MWAKNMRKYAENVNINDNVCIYQLLRTSMM